jgi:hypothetical protein
MAVRLRATATLMLAAVLTISCGGVTEPSKNTVETIPGTVSPGGAPWSRTINVNNGGEYSVKITALSPTPTATLGVGWYQGPNCEILISQYYASLNQTALSGPIFQKGAYCVAVFDIGTLTVAQTFTITVSHP